jgi:mono/diheme cytochrome c family protein
MQSGGMPTITLNAADMTALVAYLQSLGGAPVTAQGPALTHGVAGPPDSVVATARAIGAGRDVVHGAGMCVVCHGPNLEGGVAPPLTAHAWKDAPDGSLSAILAVINTGVAGTTMVAHPGGITDDQARDAAAYVWALSHHRAKP